MSRKEERNHLFYEQFVVRRVSGVDIVVAHHLPLHEYVSEMNCCKQSAGAPERAVLRALDVDLHHSLTEGHDSDQVIQGDSADDCWTGTGALSHLTANRH